MANPEHTVQGLMQFCCGGWNATDTVRKLFQCLTTNTVKKKFQLDVKISSFPTCVSYFSLNHYTSLRRVWLHLCCQTTLQFPPKAVSFPVWARPVPSASPHRASAPASNCLGVFCWSCYHMSMSGLCWNSPKLQITIYHINCWVPVVQPSNTSLWSFK